MVNSTNSRIKNNIIKTLDFVFTYRYNIFMDNIKESIAENISTYRKQAKLTQVELAEKLNYSDKAVSKWERGEAIPDIIILKQIADLFGITVDDLIKKPKQSKSNKFFQIPAILKNKRLLITILSVILVWLVATILFVMFSIFAKNVYPIWIVFILALPVSAIVLTVFSSLWGNNITTFITVTILIWTTCLSIYLVFSSPKIWLIFLIAIPLQILAALWFLVWKKMFKKPKIKI